VHDLKVEKFGPGVEQQKNQKPKKQSFGKVKTR
jgi:hypothetical protein